MKKSFPTNPANFLKPQKDKRGNAVVHTHDYGVIRIDRLVETCFHGRPGIHDRIIHIDGNPMNCCLNNLERVKIKEFNSRFHETDAWKELFAEEDEVEINVNTQEVRQHDKILPVQEEIFDADTKQQGKIRKSVEINYADPYGHSRRQRFAIEDLLKIIE